MRLTQRATIGGEFDIHDEKTVKYEEEIEGIPTPLTGRRLFAVTGSTKMMGDSGKFILNAEIRYLDEPLKITFSGKPSLLVTLKSTDEVIIVESGTLVVSLKVSAPEDVTYNK